MDAPEEEANPWPVAWAFSAVVLVVGFVSNPMLPYFFGSRCCGSPRIACVSNLRTIYGAKQTWAAENRKDDNAIPMKTDIFGATLYIKDMPTCPAGGTYTLKSVGQNPTCSIRDHTL